MVLYDNDFETKENKIETKDKFEPQHNYIQIVSSFQGKLSCKQDNKVLPLFHTVTLFYFLAAKVQHDD